MKKTVTIAGREMTLECNALLPRLYRHEFGRDMMIDMRKMSRQAQEDPDSVDAECLENVTWLMLRSGGEDVGASVEEWLGSMDDSLAVYMVMPEVVDLWLQNQIRTSKPKKK